MKRRLFLQGTTGVAGFVLFGCGDDDTVQPDSGTVLDAGSDAPPLDSGTDIGTGRDDGGTDAIVSRDLGQDTPPTMCVNVTFIMGEDHRQPHAEGLEFPASDVIAGVEKTYDITGASRHPHSLVVRAEDFARLANGEAVTIRSSHDARHSHDVILQCGEA